VPQNKVSIPEMDKLALRWSMRNGFEECQICGVNEELTFDHIIPKIRGGANTQDNICILCADCNVAKGSRIVPNLKPLTVLKPNVMKVLVYDLELGAHTLHGIVKDLGFIGHYGGEDMYAIEFTGDNLLVDLMPGLAYRRYRRCVEKGNITTLPGSRAIAIDPRYALLGV